MVTVSLYEVWADCYAEILQDLDIASAIYLHKNVHLLLFFFLKVNLSLNVLLNTPSLFLTLVV